MPLENQNETGKRALDEASFFLYSVYIHKGKDKTVEKRRKFNTIERQTAWLAWEGRCALTGQFIALEHTDLDHVVPFSEGGSQDWTNIVPTSHAENLKKGKNRLPAFKEAKILAKAMELAPIIEKRLETLRVSSIRLGESVHPSDITDPRAYCAKHVKHNVRWRWRDALYLLVRYVLEGWQTLEKVAEKLGKSLQAVVAKLRSMGIVYDKEWTGQAA